MSKQAQTQQNNSPQQAYASCESADGVSFSKGNMIVNGVLQTPIQVRHWRSSNGLSQYTTVLWEDGLNGDRRVSCNCPGWVNKRRGQPRQCAHADDLMGVAPCNKEAVESQPIVISTSSQAETAIPNFNARGVRSLVID